MCFKQIKKNEDPSFLTLSFNVQYRVTINSKLKKEIKDFPFLHLEPKLF